MIIRLGSRGSRLALAQTRSIAAALEAQNAGLRTEIVIIQTSGDRILDAPLARIGGKGVFTKEIEGALLAGEIDLAVHSLKDLPTVQPEGLIVGAIPKRESARDVLVALQPVALAMLGGDAVVGTSSLRRSSQLRARYPRLRVKNLRGNVPTRVQRLLEGQYAAIVLAEAGLQRLALAAPCVQVLDDDVMLPAPGQGALGLQIRGDDGRMAALLATLADEETTQCVAAERALLDQLGGGCQLPLGAIAVVTPGGQLYLKARVVSADGSVVIEGELTGNCHAAEELGRRLADVLRERGAADLIAALSDAASVQADERAPEVHLPNVLVTRDEDADGPLSRALREQGLAPVCVPLIRTQPLKDLTPLRELAESGAAFDAAVLTSVRALDALRLSVPHAAEWLAGAVMYCTGGSTAEALTAAGFGHVRAGGGGRDALLLTLSAEVPAERLRGLRVLYLRGTLAPETIGEHLAAWGCDTTEVTVYETVHVPENVRLIRHLIESRGCRAICFASSSAAEALADLLPEFTELAARAEIVVASIGASTTATIREKFALAVVGAASPDFASLAACVGDAVRGSTNTDRRDGRA